MDNRLDMLDKVRAYMLSITPGVYNQYTEDFILKSLAKYDDVVTGSVSGADKMVLLDALYDSITYEVSNTLDIMASNIPDAEVFIRLDDMMRV